MNAPIWIRKLLSVRHIPFEERRHPDAYTAQQLAQYEHVSGHQVAKVVVVMADGQPVELVLPASRRVVLDRVRELLNAREVRLASEEEMEQLFADCEPGALPPLPSAKQAPVVMDPTLEVPGDILFQAGTHRDAVKLRFHDWYKLVQPRVAAFTQAATRH